MIYKRGKSGIYSYRFRFAGRMIHESARTTGKTLAHIQCVEFIDAQDMARVITFAPASAAWAQLSLCTGVMTVYRGIGFILWPVLME